MAEQLATYNVHNGLGAWRKLCRDQLPAMDHQHKSTAVDAACKWNTRDGDEGREDAMRESTARASPAMPVSHVRDLQFVSRLGVASGQSWFVDGLLGVEGRDE